MPGVFARLCSCRSGRQDPPRAEAAGEQEPPGPLVALAPAPAPAAPADAADERGEDRAEEAHDAKEEARRALAAAVEELKAAAPAAVRMVLAAGYWPEYNDATKAEFRKVAQWAVDNMAQAHKKPPKKRLVRLVFGVEGFTKNRR